MDLMKIIQRDIAPYAKSKDNIWTDPYIAKQLLKAHLAEAEDGATRNKSFVAQSVDWIASQYPPADFPELLDLGCGPGIYAEKLCQKGYQVTGIDFSSNSIDYAKAQSKHNGLSIDYFTGDYLKLDLGRDKFDVILLIYCDFGVLSPVEQQLLLEKIFQALKTGGKLIFDVFSDVLYKNFCESRTWQIEENSFWSEAACLHLQETKEYPADVYLDRHLLIGQKAIKEFYIWEGIFSCESITKTVSTQNFKKIELYGDAIGSSFKKTSETICLICTK